MMTHDELEAFARAPELLSCNEDFLLFIQHLKECTACARIFKTTLELEEEYLIPLRKEWRHLSDSDLRRMNKHHEQEADTVKAFHLALCEQCKTRYERDLRARPSSFRHVWVGSIVSALLLIGVTTILLNRRSGDHHVMYRSVPTLALSAPEDNSSIGVRQMFQWQPVAGARGYIFVVYSKGEIVFQRSTVASLYVLQPEDAARLASGETYLWQVKATSFETESLGSARRRFRFIGPQRPQASLEPKYKDFSDVQRKVIAANARTGDRQRRQLTLVTLRSYVDQHQAETTADVAWALSEMALITYYLENRELCERYYRESLMYWKKLAIYPFMYAKTLSNYGVELQDNGKLGEARDSYLEAAAYLRSDHSVQAQVMLSNTLLDLGTLLHHMGLYHDALNALLETVDLDEKADRSDEVIAVAQDWIDIGNVYADVEDYTQALLYLSRAHDRLDGELQSRQQRRRSTAEICEVDKAFADDLGSLGDANVAKGDIQAAVSWYSQTLSIDKLCQSEPHQAVQTLNDLGELYIRQLKKPRLARRYYEKALPLVEGHSVDEAWRTYYGLGLIALLAGKNAEAEQWLMKSIRAVQSVSSSTADPESNRHVWANRTEPFYLLALLRVRQGLAQAALEAMEVGRGIVSETGKIGPAVGIWKGGQWTAGLEYFVGELDDPVLVVVVSHYGFHAYELQSARKLQQLVSEANAVVASEANSPQFSPQLVALSEQVFPSIVLADMQKGSVGRLVVSPDGPLTQFPITLLPVGSQSSRRFVFELAEVTIVPSLGFWSRHDQVAPAWPPNDALVVADPDVDQVNSCVVPPSQVADLRATRQKFPTLDHTLSEAESVLQFASHNSVVLSSKRAKVTTWLRTGPFDFKILHFATHAHAGDDLWSSFVLFSCSGDLDALGGRRLASLKFTGQLVVLSACDGSAGTSLSGTGSDSIASGFLMAGASTVIASSWRVEDNSTQQLMSAFYRELSKGSTVAHALRMAQLQSLNAEPRSIRSWAAFEVFGNGDLTVPVRTSLRGRFEKFLHNF